MYLNFDSDHFQVDQHFGYSTIIPLYFYRKSFPFNIHMKNNISFTP